MHTLTELLAHLSSPSVNDALSPFQRAQVEAHVPTLHDPQILLRPVRLPPIRLPMPFPHSPQIHPVLPPLRSVPTLKPRAGRRNPTLTAGTAQGAKFRTRWPACRLRSRQMLKAAERIPRELWVGLTLLSDRDERRNEREGGAGELAPASHCRRLK